jgi:hypothetical protein
MRQQLQQPMQMPAAAVSAPQEVSPPPASTAADQVNIENREMVDADGS